MGSLVKELTISLLLHLGLLVLVVNVTAKNIKHTSPIVIDLTLNDDPVPVRLSVERPRQQVATPKQTVPPPPMPVQKVQARPDRQSAAVAGQQEISAHSISRLDTAVTDSALQKISVRPAVPAVAVVSRPVRHDEDNVTPEKAQQKYLKEHFTYIRDCIVKHLSYPAVARRMGWSGRVVLSFVVAEDGSILSLQVRNSSGYPALDQCAVDTVKSVAPFPRPPVAAEIVMPVHFRLQ